MEALSKKNEELEKLQQYLLRQKLIKSMKMPLNLNFFKTNKSYMT